ncbi:MAG: hypothetical protein Q8Q28_13535 [Pseudomonadota bacterium]|nr:hypothetical protein [Pseudomonadota bacterium]
MTDTKVSRKATVKSAADKAATPSEAPELQVAAPSAPKSSRKRAPVTAKVALIEEEQVAVAAPEGNKTPTKKASRVAERAVEQAPEETKPAKVKKDKLVRDSFTMPEAEYAAIAALKERCLSSGVAARKSEILRAALAGLAGLGDAEVVAAIQALAAIKTGRPAK